MRRHLGRLVGLAHRTPMPGDETFGPQVCPHTWREILPPALVASVSPAASGSSAAKLDLTPCALLGAFGALPTAQLAEVMAMGFAAAELAGRFDAHTDSEQGDV